MTLARTERIKRIGRSARIASVALTAPVLAAACATTQPPRAPADYPRLTIKADEPNTLFFPKPGLQLGRYTKVHIAPVVVQISDDQGVKDVTSAEAAQLARYTEQQLKDNLSRGMTLVAQPGAGVLSVRFRITDLKPTSKAQLVMMVPPFAVINMLSPKGAFLGSITLAGELYEGTAKEPSVAFIGTRSRPGADATVAFERWAVAEKIIDTAAERLARDLENERSGK